MQTKLLKFTIFTVILGSVESHNQIPLSSMDFRGTRNTQFQITPGFHKKFHGLFNGYPWNPGVAKSNVKKFSGNSLVPGDRHYKWHQCLSDYKEYSIISMQIRGRQIKYQQSLSFIAFHGNWSHLILHLRSSMEKRAPPHITRGSMEYQGISHGILWNSVAAKSNITVFHGIPRNVEIVISIDIGFLWTTIEYSWNSMELLYCETKYHRIPWHVMELGRSSFQMTSAFYGLTGSMTTIRKYATPVRNHWTCKLYSRRTSFTSIEISIVQTSTCRTAYRIISLVSNKYNYVSHSPWYQIDVANKTKNCCLLPGKRANHDNDVTRIDRIYTYFRIIFFMIIFQIYCRVFTNF